jgi:hypothetical protein
MAAVDIREAVMLRAIFAGLRNAMGWLLNFAFGILTYPFTLFGGGSRHSAPGPDMATLKAAEKSLAASRSNPSNDAQSTLRDSQRDAQIAWGWITTSLLTGQQLPFPSALSNKMKSWLVGMNHHQLEALQKAGAKAICDHSTGTNAITGLPRVHPLAPVFLKFPPMENRDSDAEISDLGFSLTR